MTSDRRPAIAALFLRLGIVVLSAGILLPNRSAGLRRPVHLDPHRKSPVGRTTFTRELDRFAVLLADRKSRTRPTDVRLE